MVVENGMKPKVTVVPSTEFHPKFSAQSSARRGAPPLQIINQAGAGSRMLLLLLLET